MILLVGLALAAPAAFGDEAHTWLLRMNQASRSLNYSGTFVYQSQGRIETSRIVHLVDASGEHERLETLDGPLREVIRHNEDVQCFLPQDRIVVTDKAVLGRQPGRLITKPATLSEFYSIRLGVQERVAGRDAQQILLEPRDEMRYGHQLWIDVASGLLLKATMLNEHAGTLEQFAFSEVFPGGNIDHEKLKPSVLKTGEWRVINARGVELRPEDLEWSFRKLPPGFRGVSWVKRSVRRGDASTIHAVFSDGLANVSVFIEAAAGSLAGATQSGPVSTGSTGVYRRLVGDRLVTVLGEVPLGALRRIAEGVERRAK
ncbi:MucB/RseB C-terminal domain-containing protein [Uliginosibacterium sp. 31-16]|uniref:MucB/RseB C-terminal domain-containing protein n=1 Tax=Uliginosibacterium sp. 31-16 TaxID=3068315 RepID=UPI00273D49E2|nr:MucB/RseB C-terminal domain-containing protein [Uliginosibacterium sp. 31-16]MDP5240857.1 MucB/RseB C-terminal domain-containing protein [Uliginosibacterium sp. 31-16]